jgi:hypothetical protein
MVSDDDIPSIPKGSTSAELRETMARIQAQLDFPGAAAMCEQIARAFAQIRRDLDRFGQSPAAAELRKTTAAIERIRERLSPSPPPQQLSPQSPRPKSKRNRRAVKSEAIDELLGGLSFDGLQEKGIEGRIKVRLKEQGLDVSERQIRRRRRDSKTRTR